MKKLVLFAVMPIMAFSLLTFTSCEKLVEDASETADSAEDFAEDQEAMSDMITLVQDVATTDPYMMKKANSILPEGTITYTDSSFTDGDGMEVNIFIPQATLCSDGLYRECSLIITANKPFSEVGCQITVEGHLLVSDNIVWDNAVAYGFTINSNFGELFTISRTSANQLKVSYQLDFWFDVTDYQDHIFQGNHYLGIGNYTLTQTEGLQTPGTEGDKFTLTGGSTGQNYNGTPYTTTITEDMEYAVDKTCSKTFTKGKMTLKNQGSSSELKLDFGSGSCDNDVVITLPGGIKKTYTVK